MLSKNAYLICKLMGMKINKLRYITIVGMYPRQWELNASNQYGKNFKHEYKTHDFNKIIYLKMPCHFIFEISVYHL